MEQKPAYMVDILKTVGVLVLVLGVIAIGLRVLHVIPPGPGPEPEQTYTTLEDASHATGVPFLLPAYFPQYLRWPPVEVRGWTVPQPRISAKVVLRDSGQEALWIEEWLPQPGEPLPDGPDPSQVAQRETVYMHDGSAAQMLSYTTAAGELRHRILWDQDDVRVLLTASLSREDLILMARSMHSPPS